MTLRETPGFQPQGITTGPDNAFWMVGARDRYARLDPRGGLAVHQLDLGPSFNPRDIIAGPDGRLWVSDVLGNRLIRISVTGEVTTIALPNETAPWGLANGPDGRVWFTGRKVVGRAAPTGEVSYIAKPGDELFSDSIAAAPDGGMWVAAGDELWRFAVDGSVRRVAVPFHASEVAVAPGGTIYYSGSDGVGSLTASGVLARRWPPPFGARTLCDPYARVGPYGWMALSAAGVLWVTDIFHDSLLRLAETTLRPSGVSGALPARGPHKRIYAGARDRAGSVWLAGNGGIVRLHGGRRNVYRRGIAAGVRAVVPARGGGVWFSARSTIGRLHPNGRMEIVRRRGISPLWLTATGQGEVWFVDARARVIRRVASGRITQAVRGFGRRAQLLHIASGRNGALWVTDQRGFVHRVSASGRIKTFSTGVRRGGNPAGIALGPDGSAWVALLKGGRLLRILPSGRRRTYRVSDEPVAVAAGPDGAIWFTTVSAGDTSTLAGLGRVSPAGVVEQYYLHKTCSASPGGLISGPGNTLLVGMLEGPWSLTRVDIARLRQSRTT